MAEYKIHNRMTHWQKTYPAWISFAAIAFLLAVWEIICSTGLISSLFLPAPSAILTALGKLITSGEISRILTASLYRILLGFALGSIIGLLVGLVTGTSALMDRIGTPIVNALYPIPKIALLPLFILWLGIGELSKVTIIALGVFFPVAMNTYSGVKKACNYYYDAAIDNKDPKKLDEVVGIIAKYVKAPEADIKLGLPYIDRDGKLLDSDIKTQIDWYTSHGMIEGKLDPQAVTNTSLLSKAMQK